MSTKRIISAKVEEALRRHGLLDGRLREELERTAVIGGRDRKLVRNLFVGVSR